MTVHLYESHTAPPNRRWIAQSEKIKDNLYITFQGPTAEIAEAKLRLMMEYQSIPPLERKGFDLKKRLEALGATDDEYEDLL